MSDAIISKEIILNGKKVSYLDEGLGETIVIFQGWVVCKEAYIPLLKKLRKKYRVIVPDFPGHGESEELNNNYLENYYEFVKNFVNYLKLNKFHIIGTSLGGTLALMYAQESSIEKIILQAPLYYWKQLPKFVRFPLIKPLIKLLATTKFFQEKYHDRFKNYIVKTRVPRLKRNMPKSQWKEVKKTIELVMNKFDNNLSRKASTEFAIRALEIDLREQIVLINKPCLILWGTVDPTMNITDGKNLKKLLKKSELIEIKHGSHDMIIEKYPEIAKKVIKFLEMKK